MINFKNYLNSIFLTLIFFVLLSLKNLSVFADQKNNLEKNPTSCEIQENKITQDFEEAKTGHCTERKMTIFERVGYCMQLFHAHLFIQLIVFYYTNKAIYIYNNTPIKTSRN